MIIIDDHAELRLAQHLERLRLEPRDWEAVHLHLQTISRDEQMCLIEAITVKVSGKEPYAYFCKTGDVFLLMRSLTIRALRHLEFELKEKYRHTLYSTLSDYYDLSVHHSRLMLDVQQRLEILRAEERTQKQKEQAERKAQQLQAILYPPLDPTLVQSINNRRQKHLKPVIMVVEDEPFSAQLVENSLRGKNEVYLMPDGQSAILNYARFAPHIVFLDINLPDIKGDQILRRLLEIDSNAHIVMLSGNADKEHIMGTMQQGAKGFVAKPFVRDKLYQHIERSLYQQIPYQGGGK